MLTGRTALLMCVAGLVLASFADAQTPTAARPRFDVVSVKPNRSADTEMRLDVSPGGRFIASNLPLIQFIRAAYTLQVQQIQNLPSWASSERFDVTALSEANIGGPVVWTPGTYAPMQLMMQSVLADRFRMMAHMEERDGEGYALVQQRPGSTVGKLRSVTGPCAGDCGLRNAPGSVTARHVQVRQFAELLSQVTGRVVIDATELVGEFDFEAQWAPQSAQNSDAPSIFTAVQEQLGLRLEPRRIRLPVLVVESVQRPDAD